MSSRSLTRVGDGKESAGACVDHGDDAGDEDARGDVAAEEEAEDDRKAHLFIS